MVNKDKKTISEIAEDVFPILVVAGTVAVIQAIATFLTFSALKLYDIKDQIKL